jgi:hydroxymethylpyrimidine/phosphomethylpyrimidine kinase
VCEHLLPLTTLVTPNLPELQRLAPKCADIDEQALCLLAQGAAYVLVTGTHGDTQKVENVLYGDGKRLRTWSWERLPETYHGSGCTLAATCAANLAKGQDIFTAVGTAQAYTWGSLQAGRKVGHCQWLPNRLYWANAC